MALSSDRMSRAVRGLYDALQQHRTAIARWTETLAEYRSLSSYSHADTRNLIDAVEVTKPDVLDALTRAAVHHGGSGV